MAIEAITWPQPPTSTDANDGPTASYVMGCEFTVDEDTECPGIRWRVPDSVTTPPAPAGGHYAVLWNLDGGGRIGVQAFTPVPGGDQDILFGTPVALTTGVTYAAAVLTVHYTYRSGESFPFSTPSGVAEASTGKLSATSDPDDPPLGNTGLIFYISPLIGTGDVPAEGTVDVGLNLAVAATGAADHEGAADLGLGLAVAAIGAADHEGTAALGLNLAVAATGRAPARGTVDVGLGLAPAATGARASLGAAAVGLDLAVSASGARAAAGASALGLNLAVAARGSDGEAGRPVKPFPFGPSPVPGYPWTPRPVKSWTGEAS